MEGISSVSNSSSNWSWNEWIRLDLMIIDGYHRSIAYQTSRVTHVIASNLPATKVREFQCVLLFIEMIRTLYTWVGSILMVDRIWVGRKRIPFQFFIRIGFFKVLNDTSDCLSKIFFSIASKTGSNHRSKNLVFPPRHRRKTFIRHEMDRVLWNSFFRNHDCITLARGEFIINNWPMPDKNICRCRTNIRKSAWFWYERVFLDVWTCGLTNCRNSMSTWIAFSSP